MELWIRSQDREKLVKTKYIEIAHHYSYKDTQERFLLSNGSYEYRKVQKKDKYIKSVIISDEEVTLGTYKTEERALEVLNEIHQRLINLQTIEIVGTGYITNQMKKNGIDCVYQMPRE